MKVLRSGITRSKTTSAFVSHVQDATDAFSIEFFMNKSQIFKLFVALTLPLCVGAIAEIFTSGAVNNWYATLNRPSFSPPNWIFGPVWTTLYILMGISFFLILKQENNRLKVQAIIVFLVQLALNFVWSFIFFYFKNIGLALSEIILLWTSIIVMLIQFFKIKPVAAYLNIPYLIWVTFATFLNIAYYLVN